MDTKQKIWHDYLEKNRSSRAKSRKKKNFYEYDNLDRARKNSFKHYKNKIREEDYFQEYTD